MHYPESDIRKSTTLRLLDLTISAVFVSMAFRKSISEDGVLLLTSVDNDTVIGRLKIQRQT